MEDYIIITDSTADLPENTANELGIKVIPMKFSVDETDYEYSPYVDTDKLVENMSMSEFYDDLREGKRSSTSQINIVDYSNFFEKYLEKGIDVLYIAFSSALSGTYNSSLLAIDQLRDKYRNRKIIAVDSRAASLGEGLLVYHAVKKKESGLSIEELEDWILNNRDNLCHWFTVDDLEHLYHGGRVSRVSATIGSALKIKPVLHVNRTGQLIPIEKVRGRKKSLKELVKRMEAYAIDPEEQVIFIGHADDLEAAEYVAKLVRKNFHPKEILINDIGPIVGSHSGPGTIALFFYGDESELYD